MKSLLNIDANPKTVKGQKFGYMTAVLYLAPYTLSGKNVCPSAKRAGCWKTCLNTAGLGGISRGLFIHSAMWPAYSVPDNPVQRARLARTRLFNADQPAFMLQLVKEIDAFTRKASRAGLKPCVRLNGTSDIAWERERVDCGTGPAASRTIHHANNIMESFPSVQFYDYTKLPARLGYPRTSNYTLCISWSGADDSYRDLAERWARNTGAPLVVVVRGGMGRSTNALDSLATRAGCTHIVDGDEHDLRFLDKPHALVVLKAKGSAKNETNGFVLR